MKLRVLAFALAILAFFLFVGSPFEQGASAIVLVDDAFLAVVIAALAAFGIVFTSTGGFGTIQEFMNGLINDYALSQNTTVGSLLYGLQTGANNLGQILINNRYVVFLQTFAMFIKSRYSLQNDSTVQIVSSSASIGNVQLLNLPLVISRQDGYVSNRYELYTGTGVYAFIERNSGNSSIAGPYFISNEANSQVYRTTIYDYGFVQEDIVNLNSHVDGSSVYWAFGGINGSIDSYPLYQQVPVYPSGTMNELQNSNLFIEDGASYDMFIETGTMELPFDSSDYNTGDGAMLDVLASWGMTYETITYRVIPGTYEDTTITYDAEAVVQEQVTDTPQTNVSTEAGDYTVMGLQSVFPFCIPFDLYNFVGCLAADPVAPSFTWRFYVPGICDETIEIDLSQFDQAAQILRTMELLLFCVGLAFVTRKIIRG